MKISYAITVCNEYEEFQQLISYLSSELDLNQDEIVVLADSSKMDEKLRRFCNDHANYGNIKFYEDKFENHFADWKNKFKTLCSGDYIFQIDADEIPHRFLLQQIKSILSQNPIFELYWIPRENFVDGYTDEHIKKWNWRIDDKNRINFPDYQARLFKNTPNVRWTNRVHEIIIGAVAQANLPPKTEFSLLHSKKISRQEAQNAFYETL
jgi:hypothetical protein